MGIADRDYHRRETRGDGGFMSQLTPVVKWLLIANVGIYFLDVFIGHPLIKFGAFAVESAIFEFRIWEFITFQFLHASVGHVLFNSIGLYFFGPWMERWWGSRKFLIYYLLCGAAGAAFFSILTALHLLPETWMPLSDFDPSSVIGLDVRNGMVRIPQSLVGASAGIFGIFIGVAMAAPSLRVRLLFPPIELSMRQLAIALLVIATGSIVLRLGGNEGGEAGHLGGAILGFFLMRHPNLLGGTQRVRVVRPRALQHRFESKLRPRSRFEVEEDSTVDKILDKVSREGFQSLSDDEREILRKASERQRPDS